MVGLPYDCLANPLGAVRLTFDKAVSSGLNPSTSDGSDWGAVDLFRQFLFDDSGISQVPILNATSVKYIQPNMLVRFRGMIQDMLGNEFYAGVYKDGSTWRTNKYSDVSQVQMDFSPDMRVWERRLLYCVPVPGLNSWAEPLEVLSNQQKILASQQREKRPRNDDEAADHMDLESNQGCLDSPVTKKMREEGHPSSSAMQQDMVNEGTTPSFRPPDSEKNPFPCLVKVYDSPESDLKLNEIFEFIGVLSFDSELELNKEEADLQSNSLYEDDLIQLPPSKVPRIHCLVHKKLAVNDFVNVSPLTELNPLLIRETREVLLRHLTAVLGNDGVAAQYLLLHLLSRVHARVDGVAVGKLSLNFTSISQETASVFVSRLSVAMMELLPFTQHIPLTIEYLNNATLAPKKDYEANKLVSGVLQLAEGSHLTVDETKLQSGTLNSTGVENTRSLKNLTEVQQVEYDFKYYKMEMAADVQLLVLSEGKSNILPTDLVLPFQPSSTVSSEITDEAMLQSWRWYLATMRSLPHSISPEMQKVVEEDLVAARQADRSLGSHDFSRLLTMSRLVSLSFGETSLSMEHWQMVKELERLRKERLR
ncbi:mini-chromosome maintenance complex-binding protein [Beta vulgaris subsp. vulgaris]|uniref:mini-chromosome maintenance complex-binding protein n=1 Tax=Beta vulgaris subsp. vulgaris TaxID=3555 RepID=UPI0020369BB2|nr:mini-chromosome maintenance complex-binding protein [Beta vulgaris subsp. vulgaris]